MTVFWTLFIFIIWMNFCISIFTDANCIYYGTRSELEIQCPQYFDGESYTGIIIHIDDKDLSVKMDCYKIDKNFPDLLPNVTIGKMEFLLEISSCPLHSFQKIYKHFSLSKVQELKFEKSDNVKLSRRDFEGIENDLLKLKLNLLNFTKISDDVFSNLSNLISLDLERNKNLTLTPNIFTNLQKLRHLYLSNNELTEIPNGIFENLTNLRLLHLWGNNLTKIEDTFFNRLTNLKYLELSYNKIETVSENAFRNLSHLNTIYLSNQSQLKKINSDMFVSNKKMEIILLSYNKNMRIEDYAFANLPLLKETYLSFCDLEEISEHVFENSSSLQNLQLSNNKLKVLPSTLFKDLSKLKILNLSGNSICVIEKDLFENLVQLEELYLRKNCLTEIVFDKSQNLKIVDLSHNKFQTLLSFEKLPKLTEIDLSYNFIKRINNFIPEQVKKMDLSQNIVKLFELKYFENLGNQACVKLDHNNITEVIFNSKYLPSIRLSLKNNPIHCDCRNFQFLKHLLNQKTTDDFVILVGNLTCDKPSELKNYQMESLNLLQMTCIRDYKCPEECKCHWRPFDTSIIINCAGKNLTKLPDFNFHSNDPFNQTEVHLENNLLTEIDLNGYRNVTKLYLSGNRVTKIKELPITLEVLVLDQNKLSHFDENTLNILNNSNLKILTLGHNLWNCDCKIMDFVNILKKHVGAVSDNEDVYCIGNKSHLLINLDKTQVCYEWKILYYVLIAIMLATVLVVGISIVIFFRYRYELKVWLFKHNLCLSLILEKYDNDKTFDVFMSYSKKDEDFVVQNLVSVLENSSQKYKICVPSRDWIPGEFEITQISKTIQDSRRTLVFLSENFLDSVWCELEFRTAHTQAMIDEKNRVIIILYGDFNIDKLDKELKMYLETNTYIKWGDPYFWNKLRFALPHLKKKQCKNSQKVVNVMNGIDDHFTIKQNSLKV